MNIFNKIKENRKSILVLGVLIFNIPLVFGLISHINAQVVNSGTYQSILNTPSSQNVFTILSRETSKALVDCDANLGSGKFFDGIRTLAKVTTGGDFSTPACLEQKSLSDVNGYFNSNQEGILNLVGNVQATILEQRPLSGSYFVQQKVYALQNTGVAYASGDRGVAPAPYFPSGTGFQLLQPIQAFWGWAVNIVYGFLILLIIGIAFAIVFKDNIGGAQMVTIQNAIPSIALAMILVPLSYAISGVFIDGITVGTNLVHTALLGPGSPGQRVYDNRNAARNDDCENQTSDDICDRGLYADDDRVNWFNIQKMIDISDETADALQSVTDPLDPNEGSLVNNFFLFKIIQTILNLFAGKSESSAYWFGEIINVFVGLTMIWIGLKILWKLFQKYLMLILMPIISPFIFATAAIPGNGTKSIVEYVKMMASGSLFYIVTYAMFLLTIIFTSSAFQSQVPDIQSGAFIPPLLGFKDLFESTGAIGSLPLSRFIFTLVGLGIYFSIPKTLENIDAALGVQNAIPNFILTPLNSFRESTSMTFRAAQFAGRRVSNLEQLRRSGIPQSSKFLHNRLDKLRGLNPGDIGTWEYDEKTRLSQVKANAERAKRNAEAVLQNPNASGAEKSRAKDVIAASNEQINKINKTVDRYKFEGVGYGKETPEPEIKASIDYQGMPTYTITQAQYQEQLSKVLSDGSGSPAIELLGGGVKVKFEAIGFILPNPIVLEVYEGGLKAQTAGLTAGQPLVTSGTSPVGIRPYNKDLDDGHEEALTTTLPGADGKAIKVSPGKPIPFPNKFDLLEVRVKTSYDPRPQEGLKNFELPLSILIKDPYTFFTKELSPSMAVETSKVVFKIGQYESNPVSILINVKGS